MTKYNAKIKTLKELGSFNPHSERVKSPWFQDNTFFDPQDLLQVKYEMLRLVHVKEASKKEAANLFGVSRPTFYEAETSFARDGLVGLLPQQRGPKEAHKLNTEIMDFLEACLTDNPKLKIKDLVSLILAQFNLSVHPRSVERALLRKKKLHTK